MAEVSRERQVGEAIAQDWLVRLEAVEGRILAALRSAGASLQTGPSLDGLREADLLIRQQRRDVEVVLAKLVVVDGEAERIVRQLLRDMRDVLRRLDERLHDRKSV